jgi:hypothetical protein
MSDFTLTPECDGLCLSSADIGIPGYGIAYPHPGCPLHDPGEVCGCGQPDRCLSPTHGQVTLTEAREIFNRQRQGGAA